VLHSENSAIYSTDIFPSQCEVCKPVRSAKVFHRERYIPFAFIMIVVLDLDLDLDLKFEI